MTENAIALDESVGFGLGTAPFADTDDESFFFPSDQHLRALEFMGHSLWTNARLGVVTAEHGCGKSLLITPAAERSRRAHRLRRDSAREHAGRANSCRRSCASSASRSKRPTRPIAAAAWSASCRTRRAWAESACWSSRTRRRCTRQCSKNCAASRLQKSTAYACSRSCCSASLRSTWCWNRRAWRSWSPRTRRASRSAR